MKSIRDEIGLGWKGYMLGWTLESHLGRRLFLISNENLRIIIKGNLVDSLQQCMWNSLR